MASHCDQRNKHQLHNAILFFKMIVRTSLADGKLKIPKNFTRKYGGGMSNPVFLKPPDGTEWKVYWTNHNGEILFQKGWKEFGRYYSLDHGHMVMFKYEGTSYFDVHIFGTSATEIDYSSHVTHDKKDSLKALNHIYEDSVEILDELAPSHKTRLKSPMSASQPHKKWKTGTTGDVERSSYLQNLPQHVKTIGRTATQRTSLMIRPLPRKNGALKNAMKEAMKFISDNPFFIVDMGPSYLGAYRLGVPTAFVKKYFNEKPTVILQIGKKWWLVKVRCYPKRTSLFSSGWFQFSKENKLQDADVCIFELKNREEAVLDVHIFRGH
ncbi:hypothetical protein RIF29_14706 [Crotalaria pallida]|uniref:TF-B3 domain-containing protein n=1 Tax=Crotalaria pallida TaxID=3830 RepID=A0AAN9FKM1_CROPI